jgi:hypothetical protein
MDFVAAVCPGIETTNESFLRSYVEALQQRINRTQAGSGWYAADGGDEKLDADWLEHQFLEMVAILQMMLQFLGYTVPSTASAIGYFTLMRQQRFFHFQPVGCTLWSKRFNLTLNIGDCLGSHSCSSECNVIVGVNGVLCTAG